MNKFYKILEAALEKAGRLEPATLGKTELLSVSNEDKKQLLSQLKEQSKINNKMIIVIIILHFLLFGLVTFLILYYRDSLEAILLILGSSLTIYMVIINSLIRFYEIKVKNDYLRATLPNLSPEQAMIVVQSIYFEAQRR
jgi:hypothetical protein